MDTSNLYLYDICEECRNWTNTGFRDGIKRSPMEEYAELEHYFKHRKTHITNPRLGNGAYQGAFAFTLTKSPKDNLSVGDMLKAVRKIMSQKSCPVSKYAWYYEDKGRDSNDEPVHPHIHGMYETEAGGRIERKHFKRAWSIWGEGDPTLRMGAGFRGGYHREVRSDERYEMYIKKGDGMTEAKGCLIEE